MQTADAVYPARRRQRSSFNQDDAKQELWLNDTLLQFLKNVFLLRYMRIKRSYVNYTLSEHWSNNSNWLNSIATFWVANSEEVFVYDRFNNSNKDGSFWANLYVKSLLTMQKRRDRFNTLQWNADFYRSALEETCSIHIYLSSSILQRITTISTLRSICHSQWIDLTIRYRKITFDKLLSLLFGIKKKRKHKASPSIAHLEISNKYQKK